jgi:hypothetical protein
MAAYQNFVINAYLWLLIGILFRIPKLAAAGLDHDRPETVRAQPARRPAVRIAEATVKTALPTPD